MTRSFEQQLSQDMHAVLESNFGAGETALLVSQEGTEHLVFVLFDAAGMESSPQIGSASNIAPIISTSPIIRILACDIQDALGRELTHGDGFIIQGKSYRVQAPQNDGFGFVMCKLLERGEL